MMKELLTKKIETAIMFVMSTAGLHGHRSENGGGGSIEWLKNNARPITLLLAALSGITAVANQSRSDIGLAFSRAAASVGAKRLYSNGGRTEFMSDSDALMKDAEDFIKNHGMDMMSSALDLGSPFLSDEIYSSLRDRVFSSPIDLKLIADLDTALRISLSHMSQGQGSSDVQGIRDALEICANLRSLDQIRQLDIFQLRPYGGLNEDEVFQRAKEAHASARSKFMEIASRYGDNTGTDEKSGEFVARRQ